MIVRFKSVKINNQIIKLILTAIFVCIWVAFLVAQSPRNLLQDVNPSNGFNTVANIEATFNNGRRQEEIQLGLPTNSISNLNLPSDAEWNAMSDDARMLLLMNDERTSRAGINYGDGPVKGLPFAGVEQNIDNVSNAYAQTLFNADAFTHSYGGTSPTSRINGAYANGCREFTSRSENLYVAGSSANTGFPRAVSKAVYGFNYDDASSGWGHREMSLLQDISLSGSVSAGFSNNEGSNNSEGYIGVGVYRGTNYGGFGSNISYAVMVVFNYMDPSPSCNYNITEAPGVAGPDPCDLPQSINGSITDNQVSSDNSVTLGANTSFTQPVTISSPEIILSPGFTFDANNCLRMINEGCSYSGTFECEENNNNGNNGGNTTNTGAGTCGSPFSIACGNNHTSINAGKANSWSSYGTSTGWTGGEVIYQVTIPAGNRLSATLSGLTADLDLLLALSCSNSIFTASTQPGNTTETINITSSSGATVYLIIDGWNGASSSFNLNVSCSASAKKTDDIDTKSIRDIKKDIEVHMVGPVYEERL